MHVGVKTQAIKSRIAAALVLIMSAGLTIAGSSSASAEIANPQQVGTFLPAVGTLAARGSSRAARLSDGRVLVVGGTRSSQVGYTNPNPDDDYNEIYDPVLGLWTEAPSDERTDDYAQPTLTTLADGRVLETGSLTVAPGTSNIVADATVYDPAANTWTPVGYTLSDAAGQSAVRMADGRVLLVGGATDSPPYASTFAEVFDPSTNTFERVADMHTGRRLAQMTVLADGDVLVIGGGDFSGLSQAPASEIYHPSTNTWQVAPAPQCDYTGFTPELSVLADGEVAAVGGVCFGSDPRWWRTEIFDPATMSWRLGGRALRTRLTPLVGQLADGRLVAAGGDVQGGPGRIPGDQSDLDVSAELYDPATDLWHPAGSMQAQRTAGSATPLPDGAILFTGGRTSPDSHAVDMFQPLSAATPASNASMGTTAVGLTASSTYAPTRPGHPTSLQAQLTRTSNGAGVSGESIQVYRRDTSDGDWTLIASPTTDSAGRISLEDSPTASVTYTFRHIADTAYRQAASDDVPVVVGDGPYPSRPPSNVVTSSGQQSISASWQEPSDDGGMAITGYSVFVGDAQTKVNAPTTNVDADTRSATVSGLTPGREYTITVCADHTDIRYRSCVAGPNQTPTAPPRSGSSYQPLSPARSTPVTRLIAGADRDITIDGIASGATAVSVSAQVSAPTKTGYLRLSAGGSDSHTSNVFFTSGQTTAGLAVIPVHNGKARLHLSAGAANVHLDVFGYYAPAAPDAYQALGTAIGVSTGNVPLVAGADRDITIDAIPSAATAVSVSAQVSQPTKAGYLGLTAGGTTDNRPSTIFIAGQRTASGVIAAVHNGKIRLHLSAGKATIYLDVFGYYAPTAPTSYHPMTPAPAYSSGTTPLVAGADRDVAISGIPSTATAVTVSSQVRGPTSGGYLRLTAGGTTSFTSNTFFTAGQNTATMETIPVHNGKIRLHLSTGKATIFLDVFGYFASP